MTATLKWNVCGIKQCEFKV